MPGQYHDCSDAFRKHGGALSQGIFSRRTLWPHRLRSRERHNFRCADKDLTSLPDCVVLDLVDVRNNPRLHNYLELLTSRMVIEAAGTPALSTLDWSFTDAYSTLTKERLRRYCEKLGSSSCKNIVLRGNGLSDFHTVLDWMSGVDTWEEVDVSDNAFTSFCGDPCSRSRGACSSEEANCFKSIAILNTMPSLHTIRLSGNLIEGICSEGAGLLWYKMNQSNIDIESNPIYNIVWPHAGKPKLGLCYNLRYPLMSVVWRLQRYTKNVGRIWAESEVYVS